MSEDYEHGKPHRPHENYAKQFLSDLASVKNKVSQSFLHGMGIGKGKESPALPGVKSEGPSDKPHESPM